MELHMLTTLDNPFDPGTRFEEWDQFDKAHGYHTMAYLARIVHSSDDLSESDQDQALEDAIDEIIRLNVLGIYKKVLVSQ